MTFGDSFLIFYISRSFLGMGERIAVVPFFVDLRGMVFFYFGLTPANSPFISGLDPNMLS